MSKHPASDCDDGTQSPPKKTKTTKITSESKPSEQENLVEKTPSPKSDAKNGPNTPRDAASKDDTKVLTKKTAHEQKSPSPGMASRNGEKETQDGLKKGSPKAANKGAIMTPPAKADSETETPALGKGNMTASDVPEGAAKYGSAEVLQTDAATQTSSLAHGTSPSPRRSPRLKEKALVEEEKHSGSTADCEANIEQAPSASEVPSEPKWGLPFQMQVHCYELLQSFTPDNELLKYKAPTTGNKKEAPDERDLDVDQIFPSIFAVTEAVNWPDADHLPLQIPRGCRSSIYNPTEMYYLYNLNPKTGNLIGVAPKMNPREFQRTDDLNRAARPRRTLYLPWHFDEGNTLNKKSKGQAKKEKRRAHWSLFVADIPSHTDSGQTNTRGAPRLQYYDSAPEYLEPFIVDILSRVYCAIKHLDWYGPPSSEVHLKAGWLNPPEQIDSPRQETGFSCGLHVILNAWCHALGLDFNPDFETEKNNQTQSFLIDAYKVANVAVEGLASWELIYSFLVGYEYAMPKTNGPDMDRRFELTCGLPNCGSITDRWQQVLHDENSQALTWA